MIKTVRIAGLVWTLALFCLYGFSEVHPLKMSFSKLEISSDGVVDLKSRIFLDDITEQLLALYNLDTVDFHSVEAEATQALEHYLKNHYYFEQEGKKSELRINAVSFSKNKLAVEVHMSTDYPLDVSKELYISNTLLCDADPKQKNNIVYLNERLLLSLSNPKAQIQFN